MNNVGGFGLKVTCIASQTFPVGLTLSQFADDSDPFDNPAIPIHDSAMGLNGDLVYWKKATPIKISLGIIPGSDDDINLKILANVNRAGAGKQPVSDKINLIAIYPDGTKKALFNGMLTDAPLMGSVSSSGKLKSSVYSFVFENVV